MANRVFGKIRIKAVGTSFDNRQGKLWNVRRYLGAHPGAPITVMLRREPKNEHDPNAIAVLVKTDKTIAKIGYVPADKALWLAKRMDAGLTVRAYHGVVTGGERKAKHVGFEFTICHEIPQAAIAVEQEITK